jgi:hypothetical protein
MISSSLPFVNNPPARNQLTLHAHEGLVATPIIDIGNVPNDVEKRFGRRCGFDGYAA